MVMTLLQRSLIQTVCGLCAPSCFFTAHCVPSEPGRLLVGGIAQTKTFSSTWFFFSAFEDLCLRTAGTMEANGIKKVYEPSPLPTLYVGRAEDLLSRVPLIPCYLDGNATSTIPHKYNSRQKDSFECGCADGAGPTSRRGSHVYEINTWLWNFGRPQPRVGGFSVAETDEIRKKSRSEAAKRGWATKRARV